MKTYRRIALHTLGCKSNRYDTDRIAALFSERRYKLVDFSQVADCYIINTCAVTAVSVKKSLQFIRKPKNQNALIVVSGCMTRLPDIEIPKNCVVLDNSDYDVFVEEIARRIGDSGSLSVFEAPKSRVRVYLKIQDGCDNSCSYCVVRLARGQAKSRSVERILKEAQILKSNKLNKLKKTEVVLTGIQIAQYGRDIGSSLLELLEELAKELTEESWRIRLGSVDPSVFSDNFILRISKIPGLCPHFHLPLQSGSDAVLNNMKRNYTSASYTGICEKLKNAFPDCGITTDIITGFPGETEADFEKTLELIEKLEFLRAHIFPFSARNGTAAALEQNQIPENIKKERARRASDLALKVRKRFILRFIGKTFEAILENNKKARLANYMEVIIKDLKNNKAGEIVKVVISDVQGETAQGYIK